MWQVNPSGLPICRIIHLAFGAVRGNMQMALQMEGIGGIETARTIRRKNGDVELVFITGIKEYVFEAFDVSAFHYLLKPIEEKK